MENETNYESATMENETYENMEEEAYIPIRHTKSVDSIRLCKCLLSGDSSDKVVISERKQTILSTVARTESYLRERRIPELIRFLLTKVLAQASNKPIAYLEQLLNDCMLFRAGHGTAPVLYEHKHLEAVIKSFDPGERGWLSEGQIRRAYATLGFTPLDTDMERIPVDVAIANLEQAQENDLLNLLNAGMIIEDASETDTF